MSYTEPRGGDRLVEINIYKREQHDCVRWKPIIAGIFVAIATLLALK